jgi:rubrerythrin
MDIFDQAMGIEKIGQDLYTRFALEAPSEKMRNIFNWLADREEEHFLVFQKMKAGQVVSIPQFTILSDVADIFESWKDSSFSIEVDASQAELYQKALEAEKKSVSIYEQYAASADDPRKGIFLKIAEEEKIHQRILETILSRITKPANKL